MESQLTIEKKSSLFASTKLTVVHFVGGPHRPLHNIRDGILLSGKSTQADPELTHQAFAPVYDHFFSRGDQEACVGAKIILWPEHGAVVLQEDEFAPIARASSLARTTGIYLDMGLCVLLQHLVLSRFALDEIILIDLTGSVVWRYEKAHAIPGEQIVPGDDKVPTVETSYGRPM